MAIPQQSNAPRASDGNAPSATAGSPGGAPPATDDTSDEEHLEKALKTLREMHTQLRGLRTTIPRLLAPLTTEQPSPDILRSEFDKSVDKAMQEVKEFRQLMTAEESVKILRQAQKSRAERPKGIKQWRPADDPDWLTREQPVTGTQDP